MFRNFIFEVLTAEIMKTTVFYNVMQYSLIEVTEVLKEHTASFLDPG
jgi:hypothetical protein